jgi:SIR2-like domain
MASPDVSLTIQQTAQFEAIARKVAQGQCILFLGSAIHCAPPNGSSYIYPIEKRPVLGNELSRYLAKQSGFLNDDYFKDHDPTDLQRVSQHHEYKLFRKGLIDEVVNLVHTQKEPSPVLHMLAELPFPLVITTNYDQLFEQALARAGKSPHKSIYSPNKHRKPADCERTLDPQRPFVLKIHGDVEDPASIVITDEDYIQFVLRMGDKVPYNPVPENVRYYLQTSPILFVGYSLKDYNLRLLFKTLRWEIDPAGIPQAYAIDYKPDPLILAVWDHKYGYVKFIVTNLWEFVPRLHAAVLPRATR